MRIDIGKGTPFWVSPRPDGGVNIIQGASRLFVSEAELPHLIHAICTVGNYEEGTKERK
ncbi:hypothetical protein [Mycolicibacterium elephantis]|uniref:hypothetical protein n=1 Tax=Mycolicibacterium elephantis TaxID=81858 RepID=UPI0013E29DB1|nr:hypothetical protein [Mycolicibacterium elephantis]MCV7223153.1 hypothetical protein [Mycolicibacterium elephantis]